MSECKGCGAELKWITSPAGAKTPLDAKPKKMWVEFHSDGWRLLDCYMPHFATCPKADQFRKERRDGKDEAQG